MYFFFFLYLGELFRGVLQISALLFLLPSPSRKPHILLDTPIDFQKQPSSRWQTCVLFIPVAQLRLFIMTKHMAIVRVLYDPRLGYYTGVQNVRLFDGVFEFVIAFRRKRRVENILIYNILPVVALCISRPDGFQLFNFFCFMVSQTRFHGILKKKNPALYCNCRCFTMRE